MTLYLFHVCRAFVIYSHNTNQLQLVVNLAILDFVNELLCAVCDAEHVKCMAAAARALLRSCADLWLCYSCKPCSVCFVSGRTRKLRLVCLAISFIFLFSFRLFFCSSDRLPNLYAVDWFHHTLRIGISYTLLHRMSNSYFC